MVKILYHHRTLLDGAEGIHIREMIRAFEAIGYHVTPLSPAASARSGGEVATIPALARRVLAGRLFELAAAGYSISESRRGRRLMRDLRPDFLYKRHALNDVGMLSAARSAGVPSVLEVNVLYSSESLGQFEPLRFRRLGRAAERKALELADIVVTVSTPLKTLVLDIAPRARMVMVLPNGVDPVRFNPGIDAIALRAGYGFPDAAVVVGWCGMMRAWHGLDLLLDAVARTPYFLLFVGDGPERSNVEQRARAMGLGDRVRFAGRIAQTAVPEQLAAIDIGVVADDLTRYASPMKLLEYMAMGKPVVAPDLPNIRDVMADRSEGLLFEPGNAASLAAALQALADPEARRRLGACGRTRVENDRNWLANARRVLAAVDGLTRQTRTEPRF